MPPNHLLIRADASIQQGTGHVMRMIALAQAWACRGGTPHMVTIECPDPLQERLRSEKIQYHSIDAPFQGSEQDATSTLGLASELKAKWLVADGYRFDQRFQHRIRSQGLRLAVVTDFDYCQQWESDLVINQNPHAEQESFRCEVSGFQRLLGTRFALLRTEFLTKPRDACRSTADPPRLLVTLGGSDPENITGRILHLLEERDVASRKLELRVLVGAANPHLELLRNRLKHSRHQAQLIQHVSDMAAQYRWADGLIGAGGSSCWEWMHAGLSAAILVLADNQQPIYDHLIQHRIAHGLGRASHWEVTQVRSALAQFLCQLPNNPRDSMRFRCFVDGHGAQRIAAAMDGGVWLRPADHSDCKRYFDWANDPIVRAQSLTTEAIPWESHRDWFRAQLGSADARLFVAIRDEQPVGQIRFNRMEPEGWIVSFSVAAAARGTGIGKQLLILGSTKMLREETGPLLATVRSDNDASAACFRRLGWESVESFRSDLLQFRMSD